MKDAARRARDESLLQWAHKRKAEIQLLWSEIFINAGLPPIEITDHRVPMVARLGCAIQAVERLQLLRAEASVNQSDQWLEDERAAVRVYLYSETDLAEIHRNSFTEYAKNCPVIHDLAVNIFLIGDEELANRLQKNGFGTAIKVTSSEGHPLLLETELAPAGVKKLAHRGGGSKDERPSARPQQAALTLSNKEATASRPAKPLMSSKAEAALSILNPKSRDVNSR